MSETDYWDSIFSKLEPSQIRYDLWLEPYEEELRRSAGIPITDLGCGAGNDTLYLTERGYDVVACDYSEAALRKVKELAPGAATCRIHLPDPLPFDDSTSQVVIADLSLHYFSWEDTMRIMKEIARVLCPGGMLLCRLNSTGDAEYGAGQGMLLEPNYYEWEGKRKRFFDRTHMEALLVDWTIVSLQEEKMNRYEKPKVVWTAAACKPRLEDGE